MDENEEKVLTKKEKRALAKASKSKEKREQQVLAKLKKFSTAIVVVAILGLGFWSLNRPQKPSTTITDKFSAYAEELGLDIDQFKNDMESDSVRNKIEEDVTSGNQLGINATPTFYLNGNKLDNVRSYDDFKSYVVGAKSGGAGENTSVSETDHVTGNLESAVTLVEYSDYQCPACGAYYPLVKKLMQEMPDDFRFVYKNYPLTSIHKNAYAAATAAEAAGIQGKYWEMHDLLFERQADWSNL